MDDGTRALGDTTVELLKSDAAVLVSKEQKEGEAFFGVSGKIEKYCAKKWREQKNTEHCEINVWIYYCVY